MVKHVTDYGSTEHLLAAYAALQTVLPKNFKMQVGFGEPYKVTDNGKCNTVCNAAGWVAQHPHFKSLGLKFGEVKFGSSTQIMPYLKQPTGGMAFGYNALATVMGMDVAAVNHVFSPHFYAQYEHTTIPEVLKRLKAVIVKSGGLGALKNYLQSQKVKVKKGVVKKVKVAKKKKKAAKAEV